VRRARGDTTQQVRTCTQDVWRCHKGEAQGTVIAKRSCASLSRAACIESRYTEVVELTRAEVDRMLRRADEVRTKLRRATRELQQFGERAMAARAVGRAFGSGDASSSAERPSDVDRSR
jgi:hypothetical protein